MTKILITGANSFVGTNFRKFSKFTEVKEISLIENYPEEIDFSQYDIILHLAAIVHQTKKISETEYFYVNRDLCLRVAELSKKAGVKQFIFLSSLKVYGEFIGEPGLRNEYSKCVPDDAYGKSKYEAEIGLRKLENSNFIVSIIRTPVVYGKGVKANMISIIKLVDLLPILPFGRIANKRNFTYTENLIAFIDRIIEKKAPGVFITMDDNAISTTELVSCLAKYLNKRVLLFKLPQLFIGIGSLFNPRIINSLYGSLEFDNKITKMDLNFTPPFSTDEGLKRMVSSYLESKDHKNIT